MKLRAIVLHNVGPDMFWRYSPQTSRLFHAHTFQVEADSTAKAADLIWILTNVDSADDLRLRHSHLATYAEQMEHYRTRQNRSLSVGDVIVFMEGERVAGAVKVATVGFTEIDHDHIMTDLDDVANLLERSVAREAHLVFRDEVNR